MITLKSYTQENVVEEIAKRICESTGQEYSERVRTRVETKVKRRFNELSLLSLTEYAAYFQLHEKAELKQLLALLTIQATQFFGEYSHFEYISEHFIKPLIPVLKKRADKTLYVWSTACSRGQEAYSLAMFLKHALSFYGDELTVKVVGTDSDSDALKVAQLGTYAREEMRDVPFQYLGNDWERTTLSGMEALRAKPTLRKLVHFEYANLLGLKAKFAGQKFDLIFTRNVFTFFNESQIKESMLELLSHMQLEGRFFIGISESLARLGLPIESCGPSIYAFEGTQKRAEVAPAAEPGVLPEKDLAKVFCVDDSPAVHTLMRHILKREEGFQLTGTAMNVADAIRQSPLLREADLVTLNLQVHETALQYLEQCFDESHPPVLIITSEAKDHSELIQKSLKLGEFEWVEKPVLNHLSEHGEIVRAKLRTILLQRRNNVRVLRSPDQFKKCVPISEPQQKARVLLSGTSHLQKVSNYLRDLSGSQPPVYLFFEGLESSLAAIAVEIQKLSGKPCSLPIENQTRANPGEIWVCDFKSSFEKFAAVHAGERTSIGVFGEVGEGSSRILLQWKNAQLILEDLGHGESAQTLKHHTAEVFPASGFSFLSSEYLK